MTATATGNDYANNFIPINKYIYKKYLKSPRAPFGSAVADCDKLMAGAAKLEGHRNELIQYIRGLAPFEKHIFEVTRSLIKIDEEVAESVRLNDADAMTKGYFKIAALLMQIKLWVYGDEDIKDMPLTINFTAEEVQFLDKRIGIDLPFTSGKPKLKKPIEVFRTGKVDKRELMEGGKVINPDYEEPLRITLRKYLTTVFGIERISNFSGTKIPMKSGQTIRNVKVEEELLDVTYFYGMSQFLKSKYEKLRKATYRPLDIERKETGGYQQRRIKFKIEGGKLVEIPNGMISAEISYMTPVDVYKKIHNDVLLIQQTLTMGAKKIDNDYFFNAFYHIQKCLLDKDEMEENVEPETFERFDPSATDDYMRHRDKITIEQAVDLVREFSACDKFVFGGHMDLDLYLDGIGIRHKPDFLMVEGEGLAAYDYINNLIIIPTICPQKLTPIDQVISALADFRYALWIDSPKDIWEQQGVGFQIIGKRSKKRSSKALWGVFPTRCGALIKQRSFRDYYRRHILSALFTDRVRLVAGCDVPTTNRIPDKALRMYFDAYVPLAEIKDSGTKPEKAAVTAEPKKAAAKKAASAPRAAAAPAAKAAAPKAAPAKSKVAPASKAKSKSKAGAGAVCAKCGKPLPAGSKFCLECGAPVAPAKPKCVKCGMELPAGAKFCNECGAKQ